MKVISNSLHILTVLLVAITCTPNNKEHVPLSSNGYLQVDDSIGIFYQLVGDGEEKIIIPMGFWMYEDFKHLAHESRTLLFFDMRNRGRSDYVKDSTKISIQKDLEDIEALRQHLGWEKISLIGESYLGLAVILYTLEHPQRVDRIVQIGAVPLSFSWWGQYPDSLRNNQSNTDSIKFNELIERYNKGDHLKDVAGFSKQRWEVMVAPELVADTSFIAKMGPQWGGHLQYENELVVNEVRHLNFHFGSVQKLKIDEKDLSEIQHQVLTIHGKKDRNAPFGSGLEWAYLLPNARLLLIDQAAHIPWVEEPELVFSSINTFLDGNWPKQAIEVYERPPRIN